MASRATAEHGQTLVEFALVVPVFLLMLFGLLDVGRYVYMNSVLSQAAREGARVAAVEAYWIGSADPSCGTSWRSGLPCDGDRGIEQPAGRHHGGSQSDDCAVRSREGRLLHAASQPAAVPSANWTNTDCPAANREPNKNVVWVRVDLTFNPLTPVIGQAWTLTTSGSGTMVIN